MISKIELLLLVIGVAGIIYAVTKMWGEKFVMEGE